MQMSDTELKLLSALVLEHSGIALDASKRYLLEGRLSGLVQELGLQSFAALHARAVKPDREVQRRIIDAISTQETSFFRDPKAFDLLRHKLIPDLLGEDVRAPVSIWSAASSTGQEAYTLCIVLKELLSDLSACRVRILGTDISESAVNAANRGEFSALEVKRGLDERRIGAAFTKSGERFRVRDELRALCRFQRDNLLAPATQGPFDLILCRNVLIYFSGEDKARVVRQLVSRLKPGGALLVGATESLLEVARDLQRREFHGASYYVRSSTR